MFFKGLRPSFILSPTKSPIPKSFRFSGNLFYLKTSFSSSCFLCKSEDIIRIRKNRKLMYTRRKVFLRKTVAMKEDTFRLTGERTRPLTSMIFFQGCQLNGRSKALLRNKRANSFSPPPKFSGFSTQKRLQAPFGLTGVWFGVPGAIRTRGLSLRRRTLYPTELRRHRSGTYLL